MPNPTDESQTTTTHDPTFSKWSIQSPTPLLSLPLLPTMSTIPFLLLLLLLLPSAASSAACDGRRIHIRRLPSLFNTELLRNCSAFHPLFPSFCPSLPNSGLGDKTNNRSRSWYRTDPLLLEPLFHRRLLEYPCLTHDPLLADAVFLPYYSSLDGLRFLYGPDVNSSAFHGLHLFHYLTHNQPHIWARRHGHDHFLVMARSAWDFSQSPDTDPPIFGTSFLEIPEFYNVTALTVESRTWPYQEQAIPYPTSFHPANLARLEAWLARARRARRPNLMLFAGSGGGPGGSVLPNIRRSIREECENRTDLCEFVDCSDRKCDRDPVRFMVPMLRSRFCLHPPGNTPTRRGTFDGIIAGCIPVFFEDLGARRQYGWHLKEEEYGGFSVTVPKEAVVFGGVRVAEVLMGIGREEVARMRERVLELAPRVMYRRHGASAGLRARRDAFDVAVEGVLRRVKGRLSEVEGS